MKPLNNYDIEREQKRVWRTYRWRETPVWSGKNGWKFKKTCGNVDASVLSEEGWQFSAQVGSDVFLWSRIASSE